MTRPTRLLFDVSHSRTRPGNVGISRTVRRLMAALQSLPGPDAPECVPVSFHTTGWRLAEGPVEVTGQRAPSAARLQHLLTNSWVRRLISRGLPLAVQHAAWALTGRWTYDRLSAREKAVDVRAGDLLVMVDECWNYPAWKAVSKARERGARTVLMLHDLIPLTHPQFCAPLFSRVFARWLPQMLACCDLVMCNSKATEESLHAWCARNGRAAPATGHFRLGSDLPVQGAGGARATLRDFLDSAEPVFACIGTIEPRKNHVLLLDVFDRLWRSGANVRLLIAGRPHPDSATVVARIKVHPQQGQRLLALFDATDEELALAYTRVRALVFPSLAEGFGLPLVEARSRGCVVLASNLPALAELADEGVFLFDAQSIGELDALVRRYASDTAPARIPPMRQFTWGDSAAQFLATIRGHQS